MMDRTLFIAGWFFVSLMALQMLPITRLVYHPDAVVIEGDQVTLARSFPFDAYTDWRPRLSFVETVGPLTQSHNGGQDCDVSGVARRYDSPEPVGRWSIAWAADCLSDPSGFTWNATWYWHIGGLRVGPVSLSTRVLRDPCQYKISGTGIIHGPDSPHWSQTSTDRCFATREAAEAAVE